MLMKEKGLAESASGKLKRLREDLNLTAKEMMGKLGITRTAYWKNENGESFPSYHSLKFLSEEFDVSMDWFIFNKGPRYFKEKEKAAEIEALKKELEMAQQHVIELKQEQERLEKELAQKNRDEVRAREQIAQMSERLKPEVQELVDHMEKIPVLHHQVLLDFHKFKLEKKEIVASAMLEDSEE